MDKVKDMMGKVGGNKAGGSSGGSAGGEDYGDKGLDAAEKKFGGGKVDPATMRSTNEKITDTGRDQFEKMTGKDIPDKFSN
ncbi:MAG: hypothetical protein MMC23_003137 [Stictis urceolatum]|nr:hypothetical protein [Stictis urceolata]